MGLFSKVEEAAKNAALLAINAVLKKSMLYGLNILYGEYGRVQNLTIDSKSQVVDGDVLLKGEKEPLHFHARYCLAEEGTRLCLREIQTSREWMTLLASRLPPEYLSVPLNGITSTIAQKIIS